MAFPILLFLDWVIAINNDNHCTEFQNNRSVRLGDMRKKQLFWRLTIFPEFLAILIEHADTTNCGIEFLMPFLGMQELTTSNNV